MVIYYNLAARLRVHEEGGNIRAVCLPAATYLRVPCIPFLPERIQRLQRAFFRGCVVNLFQVTGYRFIVFPRPNRRLLRTICTMHNRSCVSG